MSAKIAAKKERNGRVITTRELDSMEHRHFDRDVDGISGYPIVDTLKRRSVDIMPSGNT